MFEQLSARVAVAAERRAVAKAQGLAERLWDTAPAGVGVTVEAGGVALSGRGLGRRFAIEPALRWLVAGLR